jgi:pimeloyl-ACP methyl ester carboxylesterase
MPTLATTHGRLSYQRVGTGPAVLLIQGVAVIGEGWRPQLDGLADRYTLITLDNRGIGGSDLGGEPLSIDLMARDAISVIDAEGVDSFHLVGHSMGGLIAQSVALAAPTRVRSLALLCTFVDGRQGARLTPSMLATSLRMRIGTRRMRRNAFIELIMAPDYLHGVDRDQLADRLAPLFGYDLANQPPIAMTQLRAMSRYDASSRWQELRSLPALIVSAAHDRISRPKYGRALAALLGGARHVEFADAGHGVTIQCAAEINRLLGEHITAADAQAR